MWGAIIMTADTTTRHALHPTNSRPAGMSIPSYITERYPGYATAGSVLIVSVSCSAQGESSFLVAAKRRYMVQSDGEAG